MSAASDDTKELDELLQRMCDSSLDAAAFARLSMILASSKAAQRRYIEYIDYCIGIAHAMPGLDDNDRLLPPQRGAPILPFDIPSLPPSSPADSPTLLCVDVDETLPAGRARANTPRWFAPIQSGLRAMSHAPWLVPAAVVVVLCGLGVSWMARSLRPPAAQPALAPRAADIAASPEPDFAARIVSLTNDATWNSPEMKVDSLFRIVANKTIHVATGGVKLEFFSGAEVILRAPAIFTPTGPDSGRLDHGRLTGKAANGNFRLTTKAAEVIDLGTEFGVAVDDVTGTDVLVFDGEVQVVSLVAGPNLGEVLTMTNGMAARIHPDGTTEHDFHAAPDDFSRSVAQPSTDDGDDELSLVDVICGGNGCDNYLVGAIDPLTGSPDSGVWQHHFGAGRRTGDELFHSTSHRPPLDGVFVPGMSGKNVQIDSLGNKVDLPPNLGQTFGPIWALRWTKSLESTENEVDFWGTGTLININPRLKASRHGVIGLHANAGFTINLQAARMQQHRGINSFSCRVANLDSSEEWDKRGFDPVHNNADFRVFVDGMLRFSRLGFRRSDGDIDVFVPLTAADQRLTLVTTEGGGTIRYDDVVLIDPILKRDQSKRSAASE